MVYGRHENVWMRCERLSPGSELLWRTAHDGDVEFVGLQHAYQLLAVTDGELHFNAAILAPELGQQTRQKILGCTDHTDGQCANFQALQPCSRVFGILQRGQHPPCENQHVFTRRCERNLTTAALEQRQTDVTF